MHIPMYIAHRGANTLAVENTIEAFELAYQSGLRAIELDIQMSSDGKLYIFHDDTIQRFCSDKDIFHHLTSQQIESLQLSYEGYQGRVMSLEDYIEWSAQYSDLVTNFELKIADTLSHQDRNHYLQQLIVLLAQHSAQFSKWLVSSFEHDLLDRFAKQCSNIAIAYIVEFKDYDADLNSFLEVRYAAFLSNNAIGIVINGNILNDGRIAQLKRYFGRVMVYTLGRVEQVVVQNFLNQGVDAIFIDDMQYAKPNQPICGKIAFLATGNEITDGDITNTNSVYMAQVLNAQGYVLGQHLACDDSVFSIYHSLQYLFKQHDIVITIGGLGPTMDDLTSQTIAQYVEVPHVFDHDSWDRIVKRLSVRYSVIPESNRKQAYFPQGAEILVNANGTADGCYLKIGKKHLFMLPGPPNELRPMFLDQVVPKFQNILARTSIVTHYYQVMGLGESELASHLKAFEQTHHADIGYRVAYPYIELKLSMTKTDEQFIESFEQLISPYLITKGQKVASQLLAEKMQEKQLGIQLLGDCMKGYLLYHFSRIQQPLKVTQRIKLKTSGMEKFWRGEAMSFDEIQYQITHQDQMVIDEVAQMRVYGEKTADYVFEYISHQLLKWIEKEFK